MNHAELGRLYLEAGDIDQATGAFALATQEQGDLVTCRDFGVCLSLGGRWGALLYLLDNVNPSVLFLHQVCLKLMLRGDYPTLAEMHRALPEERLDHAIAVYFAGVACIAEGRYRDSLAFFHRFKRRVVTQIQDYRHLLHDRNFNLVFRQGTLVEPPEYVAALASGVLPVTCFGPAVALRETAETGPGRALLGSCMNDLYFQRFGESLAATLSEHCAEAALHLHIMGDESCCRSLYEQLRARHGNIHFGLSVEPEPLRRHKIYYACNRFLVLPRLLDLYDRPMLLLDADALALQDLSAVYRRLAEGAPEVDFACFDTGRAEPASIYQASMMYFSGSARCRDFIGHLERFVWSKLDQPAEILWMLDQAALLSVLLHKAEDGSGFAFRTLNEVTGAGMPDFIDSAGTEEEKRLIGAHESQPSSRGMPAGAPNLDG